MNVIYVSPPGALEGHGHWHGEKHGEDAAVEGVDEDEEEPDGERQDLHCVPVHSISYIQSIGIVKFDITTVVTKNYWYKIPWYIYVVTNFYKLLISVYQCRFNFDQYRCALLQ